jgi:hypothetical protein
MKPLVIALLFVSGALAQNRSGFVGTPGVVRGLGSVVFPGGTSAMPGIQRTFGSVVNPAGGGPQIGIPGLYPSRPVGVHNGFGRRGTGSTYIVGVPTYIGGYLGTGDNFDPNAAAYGYQSAPPAAAPNITIIYPPAPAPMMMGPGAPPDASQFIGPQQSAEVSQEEVQHYLIPFKDHTIYSAVAFWINGDTLHYVTAGNVHNQVSLSLIDRDLMQRLNTPKPTTPIQ